MNEENKIFSHFVQDTLLPLVHDNGLVSLAATDAVGNKVTIKVNKHGILHVLQTLASDVNPMKF
ncbi:hypothetical protein [Paenibacillus xylanexedens]|uniref:hypothetical protein n=1 Tax=Paenibacillus xylanexedens TaxID=528191 RepID=UPI0011A38D27|nr:hypothetical protein [Paenibacillus xylanexedens]